MWPLNLVSGVPHGNPHPAILQSAGVNYLRKLSMAHAFSSTAFPPAFPLIDESATCCLLPSAQQSAVALRSWDPAFAAVPQIGNINLPVEPSEAQQRCAPSSEAQVQLVPSVALPQPSGGNQKVVQADAVPVTAKDECGRNCPGSGKSLLPESQLDVCVPNRKKIKFIHPVSAAWEQDASLSQVPSTKNTASNSSGSIEDPVCGASNSGCNGRPKITHPSTLERSAPEAPFVPKLALRTYKRKLSEYAGAAPTASPIIVPAVPWSGGLGRSPLQQGSSRSGCGRDAFPWSTSGLVAAAASAPASGQTSLDESKLLRDVKSRAKSEGGRTGSCGKPEAVRDPATAVQEQLGLLYKEYLAARDQYLSHALTIVQSLNRSGVSSGPKSVGDGKAKQELAAVQRALNKAVQIIHENAVAVAATKAGSGGTGTILAPSK